MQRWGQRVKNKLRPVMGDSVADEIADAGRDFSRAVRMVASAYGTLQDLAGPLERHEGARAGLGSGHAEKPGFDIDQLLVDTRGEDVVVARAAVSALVERVVVGGENVEVIPRF